jgi:hypothetical protein
MWMMVAEGCGLPPVVVIQLSEKIIDGHWRLPGLHHIKVVGIQFKLGDSTTVVSPEVLGHLKACNNIGEANCNVT